MATIEDNGTEVAINSDALDLLDCFTDGLDGLMYGLAEHFARERAGEGLVEVTVNDIERAADRLTTIMRMSDLPDDVKPQIDAMLACLSSKVKHAR